MTRKRILLALAVGLVAAACGGAGTPTTTAPPATTTTQPPTATTTEPPGPPRGPAAVEADDQEGDGTAIVVARVELPAPGFIAVHADADGAPGPVIGHSDLLPAGESTDVVVTLDEPLEGSATVWPMVHIDMDGDGVYTFMPPDDAIDLPGLTADGDVAVVPVEIEVTG